MDLNEKVETLSETMTDDEIVDYIIEFKKKEIQSIKDKSTKK